VSESDRDEKKAGREDVGKKQPMRPRIFSKTDEEKNGGGMIVVYYE